MLTPPPGLPESAIIDELARSWRVEVGSMTYRPVGWGSHHWEAVAATGDRWFVTADELHYKRHSADESLDVAFGRLRASLGTAMDLRAFGRDFVLAPVPSVDGEPVIRVTEGFGLALYPFVRGRSFTWGEFTEPEHRLAMLDLVIGVHTAPAAASPRAQAETFAIPYRDVLEGAMYPAGPGLPDWGPYARPVADLIAAHAAPIRRLLGRYDHLVADVTSQPSRAVITHGEPHPGNTMLTKNGWLLIDWDTVLIAPPERDLWSLDLGDGSVLAAYADATGVAPSAPVIDLYRLGWDLKDLAIDVSRFRRPHAGGAEDEKTWQIVSTLVSQIDA